MGRFNATPGPFQRHHHAPAGRRPPPAIKGRVARPKASTGGAGTEAPAAAASDGTRRTRVPLAKERPTALAPGQDEDQDEDEDKLAGAFAAVYRQAEERLPSPVQAERGRSGSNQRSVPKIEIPETEIEPEVAEPGTPPGTPPQERSRRHAANGHLALLGAAAAWTLEEDEEAEGAGERSSLLGALNGHTVNQLLEGLAGDVDKISASQSEMESQQKEAFAVDENVNECCETLATFITLAVFSPTFNFKNTVNFVLPSLLVWGLQVMLTTKLYTNAKINDGGQVMLDLGSGYMEMDFKMENLTCAEELPPFQPPPHDDWVYDPQGCCYGYQNPDEGAEVKCNPCPNATMVSCDQLVRCANDTWPSGTLCRRAMMDAFEGAIFSRKSGQCAGCEHGTNRLRGSALWSDTIYEMRLPKKQGGIGLCFTERGLVNGWVNLFFGMLIIVVTLIREVMEAIGSEYIVKAQVRDQETGARQFSWAVFFSYLWVTAIVVFQCTLNVYLLYASFRRMINAPNDIWHVVESSISAFLVVCIDDVVMYVLLQHPVTRAALEPLGSRPQTDLELEEERLREEEAINRLELRLNVDIDGDGDIGEKNEHVADIPTEHGRGRMATLEHKRLQTKLEHRKQERLRTRELVQNVGEGSAKSQWVSTGAALYQPSEQIKHSFTGLVLASSMVEVMCAWFLFWFTGSRLSKFCDQACDDVKSHEELENFKLASDGMSKGGPYLVVIIGMVLDAKAIWLARRDRGRLIVRALLFYTAVLLLVEATTQPAWLFKPETTPLNTPKTRFWTSQGVIWVVRGIAVAILMVILPALTPACWNMRCSRRRTDAAAAGPLVAAAAAGETEGPAP